MYFKPVNVQSEVSYASNHGVRNKLCERAVQPQDHGVRPDPGDTDEEGLKAEEVLPVTVYKKKSECAETKITFKDVIKDHKRKQNVDAASC